jgi:hypothetical protein
MYCRETWVVELLRLIQVEVQELKSGEHVLPHFERQEIVRNSRGRSGLRPYNHPIDSAVERMPLTAHYL